MKARYQDAIARFDGHCAECRKTIVRNAPIVYDKQLKRTLCKPCGQVSKTQDARLFE
jgi:hypothetical protein